MKQYKCKVKTIRLVLLFACFFILGFVNNVSAQFSIGISAEQREISQFGEPEYGLGVLIENDFKIRAPRIRFAWRAYASAFTTQTNYQDAFNVISDDPLNASILDAGLAFLLEVKMPLFIYPYGGIGSTYERQKFTLANQQASDETDLASLQNWDGNALTYDGFIGIKFSPIPLLKPYVEYRYNEYFFRDNILPSNGRLLFGVMLEF